MKIDEFLENLGLSDKEINVYLSCLELGEAGIVPIREATGMPRTTVWHILEFLKEKNLIEITDTKRGRIYTPYPPRRIMTELKSQQLKYKEMHDDMERLLPEFNRLYASSPFQPKIRFFKGLEIENIYEEILETPVNVIDYLGDTSKVTEILNHDFFKRWVFRKVDKGIWTRSLRIRGNDDPFFDPKKDLRKVRYLPEGFICPVHFYIYGDNVAVLTSAAENFGVVTTSRDYARAMKSWYQALWRISSESSE